MRKSWPSSNPVPLRHRSGWGLSPQCCDLGNLRNNPTVGFGTMVTTLNWVPEIECLQHFPGLHKPWISNQTRKGRPHWRIPTYTFTQMTGVVCLVNVDTWGPELGLIFLEYVKKCHCLHSTLWNKYIFCNTHFLPLHRKKSHKQFYFNLNFFDNNLSHLSSFGSLISFFVAHLILQADHLLFCLHPCLSYPLWSSRKSFLLQSIFPPSSQHLQNVC